MTPSTSVESDVSGKTALVTGASRGIGAATAMALARHGVGRLLLHYNTHREGTERIAGQVRKAGAEVAIFHADLARMEDIRALVQTLAGEVSHIDILINNAGSLSTNAGRRSDDDSGRTPGDR